MGGAAEDQWATGYPGAPLPTGITAWARDGVALSAKCDGDDGDDAKLTVKRGIEQAGIVVTGRKTAYRRA
jgi:hypothetical protein